MQSRSAGTERNGVLGAFVGGEISFEPGHTRASADPRTFQAGDDFVNFRLFYQRRAEDEKIILGANGVHVFPLWLVPNRINKLSRDLLYCVTVRYCRAAALVGRSYRRKSLGAEKLES